MLLDTNLLHLSLQTLLGSQECTQLSIINWFTKKSLVIDTVGSKHVANPIVINPLTFWHPSFTFKF